MLGFVSFLIVFNLLIFVHEFGHFVSAKLAGVRVTEFGFGYPPRLLQIAKWRETAITLNALPLGGFVRMAEDDPTQEGSLANKGRRVRATVYVAGAAMNLLLAIALYSVTFMMGALTPVEGQPGAGIYYVAPQSPAYEAGLRPGDNVQSINGDAITDIEQMIEIVQSNLGEAITLVASRDGRTLSPMVMTPRVNPPPEGAIGVSLGPPLERMRYPVWEAVPLGFRASWNTVRGMFLGIRAALRKEMPLQISGPIGIYQTTTEVAKTGLDRLVEFTAFLSLNLFLVNLLPLPALDGGRLIFIGLELIRGGKRIPPEKEGFVHALGMLVIIMLMLVVTFFDYQRYFG
ncbi:MAG: RIP metalloprotease RseP [Anaerolineae bacterium]|nr:RIP metalloprotease RseP [Anaerolineae bacterium]